VDWGLRVFGCCVAAVLLCGCSGGPVERNTSEEDWSAARGRMADLLRRYGVKDEKMLSAMGAVRRHVFIPEPHRRYPDAYGDHPCPIGYGQTISQPFIVAYMTERMGVAPGERILEIGTGSGYQAAVLAELGAEVYSIEIVPELAEHARAVLWQEGYTNVSVRSGDGYLGWPEFAPFDAIIVTCAPEDVPPVLVDQLRDGGRMILPLGGVLQRLVILRKTGGVAELENDLPVRFVPMVRGVGNDAPGEPAP
jgi:protein-L-isoaspartate(D-aspartate) O-methyltransferase